MRARHAIFLLFVVVAVGTHMADARAATSITFAPPAGAHVSTDSADFRTTNPQPTIGIAADSGAQLQCEFDDILAQNWQPCGAPLPGCAAVLCASFTPSSRLSGVPASTHDLNVRVLDSSGRDIGERDQGFTVDLTPPRVVISGIDNVDDPLRPTISYGVSDDETGLIQVVDQVYCSFTRVSAPPAWNSCGTSNDQGLKETFRLPRRHIDYRFQVRGVDDFGRASIGFVDYDPVPCALRASRPRNLQSVTSSGIAVSVMCSYTNSALLEIYPLAVNGRTFAKPQNAIGNRPLIGRAFHRRKQSHWGFKMHLRLFASAAQQTRNFSSVKFLVTLCGNDSCESLTPDMDYAVFTVRR